MALQGTLDTFALPDVLRLLAATKKRGELQVSGSRGTGRVWVDDGAVTSVAVDHAPLVVDAVDGIFELLRFEDGSFTFDADASPEGGDHAEVEPLLERADALLAEWREIEAVVPSLSAWVTMREELPGDKVTIDQGAWATLVRVGSGATVGAIGEALHLGELPVSRVVRDLVELGVVHVEVRAPESAVSGEDAAPVAAPVSVPQVPVAPVAAEVVPPVVVEHPAPAHAKADVSADEDETDDDTAAPIPGPRARRARPKLASDASGEDADVFVPLDLSALNQQADYDETGAPAKAARTSTPSLSSRMTPPAPAHKVAAAEPRPEPGELGDEETRRQLANLSPRAAEAIRAAANAATDDERDAALAAAADSEDEPLNRGMLLKFLSSVKT